MRERRRVVVRGIVQGVGFRPFIYGLARRHELAGHVHNDSVGVMIEVEGEPDALGDFLAAVERKPPPLARIESLSWEPVATNGDTSFRIDVSHQSAHRQAGVAPDAAVCDDCLKELFDPSDRRYRYAFINCTNCGPRFTITSDVPYDRPATTMAPFAMCPACQAEYDDPGNRRFHAQPNACPDCGPTAALLPLGGGEQVQGYAAIAEAAGWLRQGKIGAIKGLGGYHLACDATDNAAVSRLRELKHRWDKPFALMVADLETAKRLCRIGCAEAELLTSCRRPIVLLGRARAWPLAEAVAPGERTLGVMLPYTPLHHLLMDAYTRAFEGSGPAVLVMTSGNLSEEPIAYSDCDARKRLGGIADLFLMHDREVHIRCDDSVVRVVAERPLLLRRSRGYAPAAIATPVELERPVLATGAHLKNTFCLAKGRHAFVSHHIGDLENYETYSSFTTGIEHFKRLFEVNPEVVAYDLHPDYFSSKYAARLVDSLTAVGVQHHHAHIASVMGEHAFAGPVIGVAYDGTGYGTDGTVWGGEFLVADYRAFERVAHLETLPLIGGDQAVREVWRLAAAWLHQVYGPRFTELDIEFVRPLGARQWRAMQGMIERNVNVPLSSAMGRLFDAAAALIGLREIAHYEAQAAIELENIADRNVEESYPWRLEAGSPRRLATDDLLRGMVADLHAALPASTIAAKFHNTVAQATAGICTTIGAEFGLRRVVLGGGVFQNALLLERCRAALEAADFEVFVPEQLPPNDGGISYGQALVANAIVGAGS